MLIRNFWYLKIQCCVVYLFACQFWESQSRSFKTFWVLAEGLCVRPEAKKTLPQSPQGTNVVGLCVGPWHWKISKRTAPPTFLKTRRWSRWKRGGVIVGRAFCESESGRPAPKSVTDPSTKTTDAEKQTPKLAGVYRDACATACLHFLLAHWLWCTRKA